MVVLPKLPNAEVVPVLPLPKRPPELPVVVDPKAGLLAALLPKSDDPVPAPKGLDVDALFVLDEPKPPKPPPDVAVVELPNKPPPAEEVFPKPPGLEPNALVLVPDPNPPKPKCQCAAGH